MIDNKLHTPEGVKDYLPYECAFKSEIEKKVGEIFNSYGYKAVKSPTFEYMEVFDGKGSVHPRQTYKFVDRSGDVLALRSDMTPSIARIASTAYSEKDVPMRFSYIDNSFRYNEDYQGKLREFTQAGVELIGINSVQADAEVIAVAIKSLISAGVKEFLVDIGHIGFFEGIFEEANFDNEIREEIQKHIIKKEFAEVEEIANKAVVSANLRELFSSLAFLTGGFEIIEVAEKMVNNEKSKSALKRLSEIYEILKNYGFEKYVKFDLSVIGHLDYYTGIIFRGYAFGTGFSIIDGGRYDKLTGYFGAEMPAVGFAIKINQIMNALVARNNAYEIKGNDMLVVYSEKNIKKAYVIAEIYRAKGFKVENSFLGCDIEKNKEYARKNGIKIILFVDENSVKEINLSDNSEKSI